MNTERPQRRQAVGLTLLTVGAITVGAALTVAAQAPARPTQPPLSVAGAPDTPPAAPPASAAAPPGPPVPAVAQSATAPQPPAPTASDLPVADPVRLRIASIHVDANVEALQVHRGVLDGPSAFADAGWWQAGPEPGAPGVAVVAGHLDSYKGPAVFYRLGSLHAGDLVTIDRADGTSTSFTVTQLERYRKGALPASRIFTGTTEPALRLITCGGTFDQQQKSYRDNIVVYASATSGQ